MSADRLHAAAAILSAARGADHPALVLASSALASGDPAVIDAAAAHLERTIGDADQQRSALREGYLARLATYPVTMATVIDIDAADAERAVPWSQRQPIPFDLPSTSHVRLIVGPTAGAGLAKMMAPLGRKVVEVAGYLPFDGGTQQAFIAASAVRLEAGATDLWTARPLTHRG
jgi:hypothetical protein